jgi:hypothetical protein
MKISVFGKSGPRLVTAGLVCTSAAAGPDRHPARRRQHNVKPFRKFSTYRFP